MSRLIKRVGLPFKELYRQCLKHKDLLMDENDMGTFYRLQRIMCAWYAGEVTEENAEQWFDPQFLSKDVIPMEWYHNYNVQGLHTQMITKSLKYTSRRVYGRGRMTGYKLKFVLRDTLACRIDRFINPNEYMNNKILCIVGESGAGKTLASLHLQNKLGANVICSYTTRPPRPTEREGREHHFINVMPLPSEMLAYANFGGYDYYALKSQVWGECTVYVIDEVGLQNLKEAHGDEYRIFSVYITRDYELKKKVGVKVSRIKRDKGRTTLPLETYDWVIENNSTKKAFFTQIEDIYKQVYNK